VIPWHEVKDQKDASGAPTKLALAVQALIDNGCGCEDEDGESLSECEETCLAARCEAALHEQFDRIAALEAEVARLSQPAPQPALKSFAEMATALGDLPTGVLGPPAPQPADSATMAWKRDATPGCDCDGFNPVPRELGDSRCQGDGHYMCRECAHFDATEEPTP
jgi:hypothetical protein